MQEVEFAEPESTQESEAPTMQEVEFAEPESTQAFEDESEEIISGLGSVNNDLLARIAMGHNFVPSYEESNNPQELDDEA